MRATYEEKRQVAEKAAEDHRQMGGPDFPLDDLIAQEERQREAVMLMEEERYDEEAGPTRLRLRQAQAAATSYNTSIHSLNVNSRPDRQIGCDERSYAVNCEHSPSSGTIPPALI